MLYTLPLTLILCVISLFLSWKFGLSRYTWVYPIYFIVVLVYELGLTKLLYMLYPLEQATSMVNSLSTFDVVFYIVDLVIASYVLYRLRNEPATVT
jgi:hypothetical protein